MLGIIGLLTIVAIIALLLSGRISPIIGLVLVPILGALVAGFSFVQISVFFADGIVKVLGVAVMFVFAILYFGLMNDVGLFDPLIDRMIAVTHGNVVSICVGTVIVGAVAHLDGSGATTFLIALPPLLPLYRRMRMSPYLLMLLVGTAASVVNMVPWAGPLARAATVLKQDPVALWRPLIPLQVLALLLLIGMAVILGLREKRRIAAMGPAGPGLETEPPAIAGKPSKAGDKRARHPGWLWLNAAVTLGVLAVLVWGKVPSEFVFMIAASVALLINFPNAKDQMARIKAHAPGALLMA
ncbi:MAG TPA: SLC13 family permease, partial [Acidobacteriota bacterium]|nr:SLC13 family permease [Acidobacteriota bacterium]